MKLTLAISAFTLFAATAAFAVQAEVLSFEPSTLGAGELDATSISFILSVLSAMVVATVGGIVVYRCRVSLQEENDRVITVESVNYHFTRLCNYQCGFCFHTNTSSFVLPLEDAKTGLTMLKHHGLKKINFSGGEPFHRVQTVSRDQSKRIYRPGEYLGEMVKHCKDIDIESVSIVSNGSLVKEEWFQKYGRFVDIFAVSCDSFNEETNKIVGRGKGNHIPQLHRVKEWCAMYNVMFKINTVVNTHNWEENMSEEISNLAPVRWKVFQCLLIDGENFGEEAKRNAESFSITTLQFNHFIQRHKTTNPKPVPENNEDMRNSYLILDEKMRFLDNTSGSKVPSNSILDVGIPDALNHSGFDERAFFKRGGRYRWSKSPVDPRDDW